ncbi:MAG: 50S ribosomal protein L15 [bacterium]|jgi:large subunit ribosomal protein L15
MYIGELNKPPRSKKKRVGRGPGSGIGKTSGRGMNGQHSRSGSGHRAWFEGGQMPLQRRLPKRGFKSLNRVEYQLVNLQALDRFEDGATVDPKTLMEKGLIKKADALVKILGNGDISKKITVQADKFSKSAEEKIKNAGGQVQTRVKTQTQAAS